MNFQYLSFPIAKIQYFPFWPHLSFVVAVNVYTYSVQYIYIYRRCAIFTFFADKALYTPKLAHLPFTGNYEYWFLSLNGNIVLILFISRTKVRAHYAHALRLWRKQIRRNDLLTLIKIYVNIAFQKQCIIIISNNYY